MFLYMQCVHIRLLYGRTRLHYVCPDEYMYVWQWRSSSQRDVGLLWTYRASSTRTGCVYVIDTITVFPKGSQLYLATYRGID